MKSHMKKSDGEILIDVVGAVVDVQKDAREAKLAARKAQLDVFRLDVQADGSRQVRDDPRKVPPGLLSEEHWARLRIGPRKNRWPELIAFDKRIDEIEQRRAAILAELPALIQERADEEQGFPARLAAWLEEQRGPRPVSRVEEIERRVTELQAEYEALGVLRGEALTARAEFVQKHRPRLVKDATAAVERVKVRMLELTDELERSRAELLDLAAVRRWAQLFPHELANGSVGNETVLALGLMKPVKETLGLTQQLPARGVFDAVRADVSTIAERLSPEQKKELGLAEASPEQEAMWMTDPAYQAYAKEQHERLRDRYSWSGSDGRREADAIAFADRPET